MTWWQRLIAWAIASAGAIGLGALAVRMAKKGALKEGEREGRAEERVRQMEQAQKVEDLLETQDKAIDRQLVKDEAAIDAEIETIKAETESKLGLADRLLAEEMKRRGKQ